MSLKSAGAKGEGKLDLPGVSLSRITPVPVPPQFISRLHLLDWLEESAPRTIVIMAPGGFGKTMLAAQWAARYPGKVAWHSASRQDSSRDAIFSFVAAIRKVRPDFAPWVDDLIATEFDRVAAAIKICNEIATWDEDLYYVFDNVDHLPPEHIEIFQAWTENAPLNTKTISLRSTMPVVTYSRAVNMDAIRFLTSADLFFTPEEIDLLVEQQGLDATDPAIKSALALAAGWPAGVQMVLNTIAEHGSFNVTGSRVTSDLRHQHLIATALSHLSEAEVTLLKQLSFYEVFDREIIQSLAVSSTPEQALAALTRDQIFVYRVDESASEYRMNEIIRSYLTLKLRDEFEFMNKVIAQTAEYYLSQKDFLKALILLEQLGDTEKILKIAQENLLQIMFTANRPLFYRCIESLESHLRLDEAGSLYFRAAFEAVTGNRESATILLQRLRDSLALQPSDQVGTAELGLLETRLELLCGNLNAVITQAQAFLELPESDRTSAVAHVITIYRAGATAAFLMEDHETLVAMHQATITTPAPTPEFVPTISIPAISALVALADGRLRDAVELSLTALDNAEKFGISGMFFPFEAVYCLADAYREYLELEKAKEVIERYLPLATEFGQVHWVAALYAKLALVEIGAGDVAASLHAIRAARAVCEGPLFGRDLFRVIDEHELLVRAALIDVERISELLYRMPLTKTPRAFIVAYEAQKDPSKAAALLKDFPAGTPREEINKELISAQIFGNSPGTARSHLQNALKIAMNNGFRAIFTLQSQRTQNYILEIATKQPTVYLEQLSTLIRDRISKSEQAGGLAARGGIPLTKRELDILRRLATGLPISQIAGSIHISQNTIKTHLKNLYRKMQVESREEAVTRGRELSLL